MLLNAKYLTGTNRIVVYRNEDGGVMLRSAAHETYHFVENYSAKDAADLRDYVVDALKGKGVNIDVTNLIYRDEDGIDQECYMNIDVKEKADGHYFYSFAT